MASSRLAAAAVWIGCSACAARAGLDDIAVPTVVAPAADAVVEAGSVPVLVRLPRDLRFHTAELSLNEGLYEAVAPIVRRRWWTGKGVDLFTRVSTADLAPGTHRVRIDLAPPTLAHHRASKEVRSESVVIAFEFELAPRGPRVMLHAVDETGAARGARFQVFDESGALVDLGNMGDADADPSGRDSPRTTVFGGSQGVGEYIAPGTYEIWASGGVRDGIHRRVVEVVGPAGFTFTVPRLVETPGELAADFHVHTGLSSDSFIPDRDRFLALSSAGVDVAVVTDHNRVRNVDRPLAGLGLTDSLSAIAGAEMRLGRVGHSYGHANAFPLPSDQPAPTKGRMAPARAFEQWRSHHHEHSSDSTEQLVIQLNHPRGIQFKPDKPHRSDVHALFEETGFDPTKPIAAQSDRRLRVLDNSGRSLLDVDAIEVMNRFSLEGWRRVRADWFNLMNRGHRLTGTGNSDSHTSQLEPVGFPVNLVTVDTQRGHDGVLEGLRMGRVRVSNGPLVQITVRGDGAQVSPSKTTRSLGSSVLAVLDLAHADWVEVPEVRLVMNGAVIWTQAVEPNGPRQWSVPVEMAADSWLLAEAGWPLDRTDRPTGTPYDRIATGHVPIGFTNPVYLDADGDGRWTPTAEPADQGPR